jgi:hypothetical protein
LYEDIHNGRIRACENNKKIFEQNLKISAESTNLYDIDKSCYSGPSEDYSGLKERLSSINSIRKLKIPSLFIQSQEDPFCMYFLDNLVPSRKTNRNLKIQTVFSCKPKEAVTCNGFSL